MNEILMECGETGIIFDNLKQDILKKNKKKMKKQKKAAKKMKEKEEFEKHSELDTVNKVKEGNFEEVLSSLAGILVVSFQVL